MTPAEGDAIIAQNVAPWVQALRLRVSACDSTSATLWLPCDASLVRVGGIICGQALMSAADTAMVIAIASALGVRDTFCDVKCRFKTSSQTPRGVLQSRTFFTAGFTLTRRRHCNALPQAIFSVAHQGRSSLARLHDFS